MATSHPPSADAAAQKYRAEFADWDRSLKVQRGMHARLTGKLERARGAPLPAGPLVFVTDMTTHTGVVIQDKFVPRQRQLETGKLLLDEHETGRRWLYYERSPFDTDPIPRGALVALDARSGETVLADGFKPTDEQLKSGAYWLDSHDGVHRWYLVEDLDAGREASPC